MSELDNRKKRILAILYHSESEYVTSQEISDAMNLSIRTIKTAVKELKEYGRRTGLFDIQSIASKGLHLSVHRNSKFLQLLRYENPAELSRSDSDQFSRIIQMMSILVKKDSYVSKSELLNQLFISESTFYSDLFILREKLKEYNIQLVHKTNYGYRIIGSELDKRLLINCTGIVGSTSNKELVIDAYDVVTDAFIKNKYQVDEQIIQNITNHVVLTVSRLRHNSPITENVEFNQENSVEYKISTDILQSLIRKYQIYISSPDIMQREAEVLAQIILGKSRYSQDDALKEKINLFIHDALKAIYAKYSINFESNESLQVYLSLHLVPLYYRAHSRTQLKNPLAVSIQQDFPLSYDIALYFSDLFQEKFNLFITRDEVSYLSLYFNYGIETSPKTNPTKNILILTTMRFSETVLLRHQIMSWFQNEIANIDFVNPDSNEISLKNYDAVFSTDSNLEKYHGGVTTLHAIPTEADRRRMNMALNGYSTVDTILSKFRPDLFYCGPIHDKTEAIRIVCSNAEKTVKGLDLKEDLTRTILYRETIATTYFGNGIAIPHPLTPITSETYVSVAISDKPIRWDAEHNVRIVMLVLIERNNPKALQLWHYISNFVHDTSRIRDFLDHPDYESLLTALRESLLPFYSQ